MNWLLTIETAPGASNSEDTLELLHDKLDELLTGECSCSVDRETGVLSATFEVAADSEAIAVEEGVATWGLALKGAGVAPDRGSLTLEPVRAKRRRPTRRAVPVS